MPFGSTPGKGTINAMYIINTMQRNIILQKMINMRFVNFEKNLFPKSNDVGDAKVKIEKRAPKNSG